MRYFKKIKENKKRVEGLENEKNALQRTILEMSAQISTLNIKVEFLKEKNKRLNWTITNGKGY